MKLIKQLVITVSLLGEKEEIAGMQTDFIMLEMVSTRTWWLRMKPFSTLTDKHCRHKSYTAVIGVSQKQFGSFGWGSIAWNILIDHQVEAD